MKNPVCEICGKNAETKPIGCKHYPKEIVDFEKDLYKNEPTELRKVWGAVKILFWFWLIFWIVSLFGIQHAEAAYVITYL